ncbi:MAG: hypothetical protein PHF20_10590 [Halothiobacillaceae bacterium]|nr:hypothetical protein [Halothiobacillaceae bacterium]
MSQSARITIPSLTAAPTPAQQRAYRFVSARIAAGDAAPFHAGYIHGLIQALVMAGALTVNQACELEHAQERASCDAHNRRAIEQAPRRAVGGAA